MQQYFIVLSTLVFAVVVSTMHSCAFATTYYVAVTGSDSNSGTQTLPFLTLQKAANIVKPGDTVIVGDGTYTTPTSQFIDMSRAGTGSAWITFMAEHKSGAKLNGQNNKTQYMIIFEPHHGGYIRIQDFEIYGFQNIAIVTTGTHDIDIIGNDIHEIGRFCNDSDIGIVGVYGNSSPNVTIEMNVFHDIGRFSPGENGCQPTTTYWQNHDHAVYLDGMNKATVISNIFYNIQHGWPIHLFSSAGASMTNMLVSGNTFFGANPNRDGHIALAGSLSNSTVANNIFHEPRNCALYFGATNYTYSAVTINNNITYAGSISATLPSGVTFAGNK